MLFNSGKAAKAFHQWMAQTSTLLLSYSSSDNVAVLAEQVVDEMERRLKPRMKNWYNGLRKQLHDIVMEAIRLDADLCQQQAWWYCHYPEVHSEAKRESAAREEVPFSAEWMKLLPNADPDPKATHAQLLISPALVKAGNSRGDEYDRHEPRYQSIVLCGRPAPPLQHSKSKPKQAGNGHAEKLREAREAQRRDARDGRSGQNSQGMLSQMKRAWV